MPHIQPTPPAASGSVARYEHTQAAPATPWVINHNLGRRPAVAVMTLGGQEMLADVLHMSANQVQVFFDGPTAGLAILN